MAKGARQRAYSTFTRRRLLQAGMGAAAAGLLAISPRPQFFSGRAYGDATGEPLIEPPVLSSSNGLLDTSLRASVVAHPVARQTAISSVYNEEFPSVTWRIRPGDRLRVDLSNQLDTLTNLHLHGLHVSPSGNSDNVLLHIHPGESFQYEYAIPTNHPAGLYWYHPHFHGLTTEQLFGGMAGAIIIEGDLDQIPGIAGVPERLLMLHTIQLDPDGRLTTFFDRNQLKFLRTVNGQLNPTFTIRPGETQRLRIANISVGNWFRLKLDGHVLHQIAKDGNTLNQVWSRDEIIVAPAERVEVLIQGGPAGQYALRTLPLDQGFAVNPETVLATLISEGSPVTPQPLPTTLLPFDDLSNARIDQRRDLSMQVLPRDDPQRAHFMINSHSFDEDVVDLVLPLNNTEEWVLHNPSNVFHPFHIHINPFQVMSVNGQPVTPRGLEDTVSVPPRGEVVIRQRYLDFTGKFVFHCHVLPHEDGGMMSVVEVVADAATALQRGEAAARTQLQMTFSDSFPFTCPLPGGSAGI